MRKPIVSVVLAMVCALTFTAAPSYSQDHDEDPLFIQSKGRTTFKRYCASCHGKEADGKGIIATMLKVEPSDLRVLSAENEGEFPAERVAEFIDGRMFVQAHGQREMPVWGEVFQTTLKQTEASKQEDGEKRVEQKVKELSAYLESIQIEDEAE